MRIATLNLNGLRAAHSKNLSQLIALSGCDIICFQEIRTFLHFDHRPYLPDEYHYIALPADKPGYSGVLIAYKSQLFEHQQSLYASNQITLRHEGRLIGADFCDRESGQCFRIVNGYWPSGSSEMKQKEKIVFLHEFLSCDDFFQIEKPLFVAGDINIAATDRDLKNWKSNKGQPGCTAEERELLQAWVRKYALKDSYRALAGDLRDDFYTWWSYRQPHAFFENIGWRIDAIYGNSLAAQTFQGFGLLKEPRCSDHGLYYLDCAFNHSKQD